MIDFEKLFNHNLPFRYLNCSIICALAFILLCTLPYSVANWKTSLPTSNLLYWAIAALILGEIIFWLDEDDKPFKNESIMSCTLGNKVVDIILAFCLLGLPALIISLYQKFPKEIHDALINIFGGLFALVSATAIPVGTFIICAYGLIYLNSLKYRRKKKKRR